MVHHGGGHHHHRHHLGGGHRHHHHHRDHHSRAGTTTGFLGDTASISNNSNSQATYHHHHHQVVPSWRVIGTAVSDLTSSVAHAAAADRRHHHHHHHQRCHSIINNNNNNGSTLSNENDNNRNTNESAGGARSASIVVPISSASSSSQSAQVNRNNYNGYNHNTQNSHSEESALRYQRQVDIHHEVMSSHNRNKDVVVARNSQKSQHNRHADGIWSNNKATASSPSDGLLSGQNQYQDNHNRRNRMSPALLLGVVTSVVIFISTLSWSSPRQQLFVVSSPSNGSGETLRLPSKSIFTQSRVKMEAYVMNNAGGGSDDGGVNVYAFSDQCPSKDGPTVNQYLTQQFSMEMDEYQYDVVRLLAGSTVQSFTLTVQQGSVTVYFMEFPYTWSENDEDSFDMDSDLSKGRKILSNKYASGQGSQVSVQQLTVPRDVTYVWIYDNESTASSTSTIITTNWEIEAATYTLQGETPVCSMSSEDSGCIVSYDSCMIVQAWGPENNGGDDGDVYNAETTITATYTRRWPAIGVLSVLPILVALAFSRRTSPSSQDTIASDHIDLPDNDKLSAATSKAGAANNSALCHRDENCGKGMQEPLPTPIPPPTILPNAPPHYYDSNNNNARPVYSTGDINTSAFFRPSAPAQAQGDFLYPAEPVAVMVSSSPSNITDNIPSVAAIPIVDGTTMATPTFGLGRDG